MCTSPHKTICCGPCQLFKQPPPVRQITQWPCPCSAQAQTLHLITILLLMTHGTQGHVPFHLLREASSAGVCVNVEPDTERPPDNLGGPVPIYTASRWCLSVVWQEGVRSNCVKQHIVMVDKESLLSSWYKVQVKLTKDGLSWQQRWVCVCSYFRDEFVFKCLHLYHNCVFLRSRKKDNIKFTCTIPTNWTTLNKEPTVWNSDHVFFFSSNFFFVKTRFYIPKNSWSAKLVWSSKQTGEHKTCRGLWTDTPRGNGWSMMILVGHRHTSCVCLKALVKV